MSESLKCTKKWAAISACDLSSAALAWIAIKALWCCWNVFAFGQFGILAASMASLAWSFARDEWGW